MITFPDEKENKRLEMIGQQFKVSQPQATLLIEIEHMFSDDPKRLAIEVAEIFPKIFGRIGLRIQDDWEEWCEQYDASADPVLDKFHYHRAQT